MTQHDSEHLASGGHGKGNDCGDARIGREQGGAGPVPDQVPPGTRCEVALRGPGELADALPYLLGFHPDDSILVVALHGERGKFGGRMRTGIPVETAEWSALAAQIASGLQGDAAARGQGPDGAVVFLCQEPAPGESGRKVMERLRPLAQALRRACGERDMPVYEALCVSTGRYWSYCCPDPRCCPPEGRPLSPSGTSAMAAAAAYAGVQVGGSLREMEARLAPLGSPVAEVQRRALDSASAALTPLLFDEDGLAMIRARTLHMLGKLMTRFRESAPSDGSQAVADAHDDGLLEPEEAAAVILGLQDRCTRDRAAEWMEGRDATPALRMWRALARRCVGPYLEHAAAPLALAGWVAWSIGNVPMARVALGRALRNDPEYVFAKLLHRACNDGLDPEPLRHCMRRERAAREATQGVDLSAGQPGSGATESDPGGGYLGP
jgi:hypothetical protein